jgi:hypothetical protein
VKTKYSEVTQRCKLLGRKEAMGLGAENKVQTTGRWPRFALAFLTCSWPFEILGKLLILSKKEKIEAHILIKTLIKQKNVKT